MYLILTRKNNVLQTIYTYCKTFHVHLTTPRTHEDRSLHIAQGIHKLPQPTEVWEGPTHISEEGYFLMTMTLRKKYTDFQQKTLSFRYL